MHFMFYLQKFEQFIFTLTLQIIPRKSQDVELEIFGKLAYDTNITAKAAWNAYVCVFVYEF